MNKILIQNNDMGVMLLDLDMQKIAKELVQLGASNFGKEIIRDLT